jgi:uncharacterized protein
MHLVPVSAAALLALAVVAAAQSPPPAPDRYVTDYAGLVDAGTAGRIDEKLRAFDQQTSSQVLVAIFPELPGGSLEDFTVRTAEAWKAGRKELDNGVVLFVFVKDRKVRMEVGYGLEGALPDATAKRIIDERITPAFREGRYAAGLEAGVDAILAATRGEYTAPPPPKPTPDWVYLLVPLVVILLNWWLFNRTQKGRYVTYSRAGRRGGRTIWYGGGGGWYGGGGGNWGDSGGGGGFSGGGGSFGGGGASGDW